MCPKLDALVPENPNKPYDVTELIKEVADGGSSSRSRPSMPECGGRVCPTWGRNVGVIANQPTPGGCPRCR